MSRQLRLLALVQKAPGRSPGQRYRLEQWAPHLSRTHGIALEFCAFESAPLTRVIYQPGHVPQKIAFTLFDMLRRVRAVLASRRYDGVVLYREAALLGPPIYEELLARLRVPTVLDFDDAIWMSSGGGVNGAVAKLRWPQKTARLCELADAVTVGNAYLADWAGQHARDVSIVPTTIELGEYPVFPEPAAHEPFTIVWTGSHSTLQHLETVRPALERFAQVCPTRARLRVICDRPPARPITGLDTEFVPWRAATEAADIAKSHVGLMPLPDDAFARGKCSLKALQCMAVGRPVIVSPVGANMQVVTPEKNGLWASTSEEWVAALQRLAQSQSLRAELGAEARRTVEARYSAEVGARGFAEAVRRAVHARGAQAGRSSAQGKEHRG